MCLDFFYLFFETGLKIGPWNIWRGILMSLMSFLGRTVPPEKATAPVYPAACGLGFAWSIERSLFFLATLLNFAIQSHSLKIAILIVSIFSSFEPRSEKNTLTWVTKPFAPH
jgi:hypothetical protein